jgi:hypothetical protein
MIDTVFGLPAHPLLIHAAVVFGPLLVAAVVLYALVPALRPRLGWLTVLLAIAAPIALWLARLSGERFMAVQKAHGANAAFIARMTNHQGFGNWASWSGTILGVLTLLLVFAGTAAGNKPQTPSSRTLLYTLIAASLIMAAATGYYVFKTGDSGARMVWG